MKNIKIPNIEIIEFGNNEEFSRYHYVISNILQDNISPSYSHSYEERLGNCKFNKVLEHHYNTNPRICIRTIEYCEEIFPERTKYKVLKKTKTLHIFNKDGSEDMIRI